MPLMQWMTRTEVWRQKMLMRLACHRARCRTLAGGHCVFRSDFFCLDWSS
ncbi:unnamed protein product [Caenorhabditis auriculariae]|uniref:Uncharacterized protein n=1 Tax=Caenorhabditis auriculariae TaxID=2777116 RepID=A0A8S1GVE9_9PELO|nr:unnamed protein product [Caenorhabditis auriculariae]